jgi:hypothetical protein
VAAGLTGAATGLAGIGAATGFFGIGAATGFTGTLNGEATGVGVDFTCFKSSVLAFGASTFLTGAALTCLKSSALVVLAGAGTGAAAFGASTFFSAFTGAAFYAGCGEAALGTNGIFFGSLWSTCTNGISPESFFTSLCFNCTALIGAETLVTGLAATAYTGLTGYYTTGFTGC